LFLFVLFSFLMRALSLVLFSFIFIAGTKQQKQIENQKKIITDMETEISTLKATVRRLLPAALVFHFVSSFPCRSSSSSSVADISLVSSSTQQC
jgi:hypothetical protein